MSRSFGLRFQSMSLIVYGAINFVPVERFGSLEAEFHTLPKVVSLVGH